MLISTTKQMPGKQVGFEKEKIVVYHAEDVTEVLRANHAMRRDWRTNGFTKERKFRQIGQVPAIAYFAILQKYPEIEKGDALQKKRAWRKALKDPEFAQYATVEGGI